MQTRFGFADIFYSRYTVETRWQSLKLLWFGSFQCSGAFPVSQQAQERQLDSFSTWMVENLHQYYWKHLFRPSFIISFPSKMAPAEKVYCNKLVKGECGGRGGEGRGTQTVDLTRQLISSTRRRCAHHRTPEGGENQEAHKHATLKPLTLQINIIPHLLWCIVQQLVPTGIISHVSNSSANSQQLAPFSVHLWPKEGDVMFFYREYCLFEVESQQLCTKSLNT